jgi:hypothetical protein
MNNVDKIATEVFRKGKLPHYLLPGDIILFHGKTLTSWIIRFGQSLRFRKELRKYSYWNHVAVAMEEGYLAEALLQGVVRTHISDYVDEEFIVVRVNTEPVNRKRALLFLSDVLGYRGVWKKLKGWAAFKRTMKYIFFGSNQKTKYGFLTIVNVFLTMITGWGFVSPDDNTAICSGLGSETMVRLRGDIIFDSPLYKVSPAEIMMVSEKPSL